MQENFVILDGNSLLHRSFHALPKTLKTSDGTLVNAVYGFASVIINLLTQFYPSGMAVAFDKKGPTFRHLEFKEYKATRKSAPDELYQQIPIIKDLLKAFNINFFEKEGFEADDIIAHASRLIAKEKNVIIYSSDLDLLQLVADNITLAAPQPGNKILEYTPAKINEKYMISPQQITDLKGLKGDSSDNLAGVPGIGEKTAMTLLQEFTTIENIFNNLEKIPEKIRRKLEEGKESAFLSKRLATLNDNFDLTFETKKCALNFDFKKIDSFFEQLKFFSLKNRFHQMVKLLKNDDAKIFVEAKSDLKLNLEQNQHQIVQQTLFQ